MKNISAVMVIMLACSAAAGNFISVQGNGTPDPGERDISEIREKITEVKETVQTAYGELLVNEPEATGEIEVSFLITPDGSVTGVEINTSEGLTELNETVTEAVEALDFGPCPGQEDDLPITVPFSLMPGQED